MLLVAVSVFAFIGPYAYHLASKCIRILYRNGHGVCVCSPRRKYIL